MTDDELDDLLSPKEPPPGEALREAVFARTVPLLRPPRVWKRLAWPGVFALGIGAGWFAKPTPPPERTVETIIQKELVPVPVEAKSPGEQFVELSPDRLELEAEKAAEPAAAAKLFQQAGDAYLKANQIESAIRCYRQYQTEAGADGRVVRADDSWLLTSIKNSKQRENDHAKAD